MRVEGRRKEEGYDTTTNLKMRFNLLCTTARSRVGVVLGFWNEEGGREKILVRQSTPRHLSSFTSLGSGVHSISRVVDCRTQVRVLLLPSNEEAGPNERNDRNERVAFVSSISSLPSPLHPQNPSVSQPNSTRLNSLHPPSPTYIRLSFPSSPPSLRRMQRETAVVSSELRSAVPFFVFLFLVSVKFETPNHHHHRPMCPLF